jgi:hypothetical protein
VIHKILSRKEFNGFSLKRDGHKCVVCKLKATEVHHLIDRKLFGRSNGYYLDNAVSLCNDCHFKAETTEYSVEYLRELAQIKTIIVPDGYDINERIDKWGNPIIDKDTIAIGEYFYKENVQKILRKEVKVMTSSNLVKYPRTYHVPWSKGTTSDDRILTNMDHFIGREVIVTEKLDGENSSLYRDHYHARSLDSGYHESREWIKALHGRIAHLIPEGYRICGENMFAKHSLLYDHLSTYFYVFNIWNEENICLSYDETLEWCELLELNHVPVIYRGMFDEAAIKNCWKQGDSSVFGPESEGFVLRVADSFHYGNFENCYAKNVRENHVQTDQHWKNTKITPNIISEEIKDE